MGKSNYDYIIIIHRLWTQGIRKRGGVDKILDYLSYQGKKILLIEHPLEGLAEETTLENYLSVISKIDKRGYHEIEKVNTRRGNTILSWMFEILFNYKVITKYVCNKPVFVSSDPLNSLTGIVFFWKFVKKYFHCVDYSENRFNGKLLNYIYQVIYNLTFISFDLIGVVSLRTKSAMIKKGCSDNKIFYIPNSPMFVKHNIPKDRDAIIAYSSRGIMEKYNYTLALEILRKVKKINPNVKMYLIGGTEQDPDYVNKIRNLIDKYELGRNIEFTGYLEQDKLNNILLKSKIGFCFYSESVKYHTFYGDSLKIREYALYGIPTISDGNSATDEEMAENEAGIVITNAKEGCDSVVHLLTDRDEYSRLSNNCIKWSKRMDKNLILRQLMYKLN